MAFGCVDRVCLDAQSGWEQWVQPLERAGLQVRHHTQTPIGVIDETG